MSDMHNWRISVEQCHAKHIGPPPSHLQRINYDQAHRLPMQADGRARFTLGRMLRSIWRLVTAKRL